MLLESAKKTEPDFPDGRDLVLTHFAEVGQLMTSGGDVIYVVEQHSVTAGALAPHGQQYIIFFDKHLRFLGEVGYRESYPLWCEGSRLYLFGDLQTSGFFTKFEKYPPGNVIDVADGFENIKVYHTKVYGSSGGIEDN